MTSRLADLEARLMALDRSQAVIEFEPDGTIVSANDNYLAAMGYALPDVQGKHHRMFVDAAEVRSDAYRRFWDALAAGQFQAAEYKRFGKGGREIWIQASYNPILDMNGRPFKVVKFASDITARIEQGQRLATLLAEIDRNAQVLSSSSGQLSSISEVMGANAEQTSAQAGVVAAAAEQVSRNVQTVATGTEEMGASIREIAKNANDAARVATQAVKVTETTSVSIHKLGESSVEIGKVNDISATIASAVEEQTATTNEIGRNVVEAARGSEEIARNITGVAQAAHSTTSGAHEAREAAVGLSGMAADLTALVSGYRA